MFRVALRRNRKPVANHQKRQYVVKRPNPSVADADSEVSSSIKGSPIVRPIKKRTENEVWELYRTQLRRFVLKRVNDASLAEDIVQDVLLKAYTKQDALRDPSKLQAWLYQITRNSIVDYFRSPRSLEPLPEQIISKDPPVDETARQELARCLVPLIEALPSPYRSTLDLVEIKGLKQREVASKLGLSLSGVKSRVQRARKMLATILLQCCQVEFDRRGDILDYNPHKKCDGC